MSSEIKRLKKENDRLKKELDKILEEKDKILKEKNKIEKEFEEFKAKHSHTVDELKQAMHLKPNLKIRRKGLGAKKGHSAYTRRIPERVDYVQALNPKKCPFCDIPLPEKSQEIRKRYVTDIKFITSIENTCFEIHRKYCKHCKKIVEMPVPNVLPHARYGLTLMLYVMYLRVAMRMPMNKIREYFQTIHGLHLGEGEISLILQQLARAFGPYYKQLEIMIKVARVKHTDTTSWRTEKKNLTAWVFVMAGMTLYKITRKGNAKVPLKIFGKKQQGNILVVDRHSVNRSLANASGFTLQFCWSHILEDSKALAKDLGREGKYVHKKLKKIFDDAVAFNHKGTDVNVEELKKRVLKLVKKHYQHLTVWKFIKNLAKRDIEGLFIFVRDPSVDPTNNLSERKLRSLVVFRKITNGSRSIKGAETTAILFSVVETLRSQGHNILNGLHQTLQPTSEA